MLNPANEEYLWVAGALCVGVASISMSLTKTVHPPGGAAALLCAIDPQVRDLGWFYLVVQIVSGLEMITVACLFNNVQRKYPLYWWTPQSLSASGPVPSTTTGAAASEPKHHHHPSHEDKDRSPLSRLAALERILSDRHVVGTHAHDGGDLVPEDLKNLPPASLRNLVLILPTHFALPKGLELTEEEETLLVNIQQQLKAADSETSSTVDSIV